MIVIVDYGMGNIGSIMNMIRRAGGESMLTADHAVIKEARKLILPGVGSFDHGMNKLNELGLADVLHEKVLIRKTPILGICLGMQLMTQSSEEGLLKGLGWLRAKTVKFHFEENQNLRIPHMGWNDVEIKQTSPLFDQMPEEPSFYFVHSYHVLCEHSEDVATTTRYGDEFVSAVQSGNIMATQFHPEKSHKFGLQLITNFVNIPL